MQASADTVGLMERIAGSLDRAPVAVAGAVFLAGLVLLWRHLVKRESEHREEIRALHAEAKATAERHAKELGAVNEARLQLAAAFEGTVRTLLIAAKSRRRESRPRLPAVVPAPEKSREKA